MKKIAVTGANGFIGSRLCSYLKEQDFEVLCLVRPSSETSLLDSGLKICRVDYNDIVKLEEILSGVEVIIHLAALTRAKKWDEFQKTNIDLVDDLINISNHTSSVKQFIFMSSQAASGPSQSASGKKETETCNPVTMYGKSKLKAEEIVISNSIKPWTIFRSVSVFGPGEKDFLEYYRIVNKGFAPLIGLRNKYLSLIYVDDLCRMIALAIGNHSANNQVFFASSSENISMAGFASFIARALNKSVITLKIPHPILWIAALILEIVFKASKRPAVLNRDKFREMTQRYWLADNSKAKRLLGYTKESTLINQIHTTIEWNKKRDML